MSYFLEGIISKCTIPIGTKGGMATYTIVGTAPHWVELDGQKYLLAIEDAATTPPKAILLAADTGFSLGATPRVSPGEKIHLTFDMQGKSPAVVVSQVIFS